MLSRGNALAERVRTYGPASAAAPTFRTVSDPPREYAPPRERPKENLTLTSSFSPTPAPDQVDRNVFIGDDLVAKTQLGFTHIVNCTRELPNYFERSSPTERSSGSPSVHYLRLGLLDNPTIGDEDLINTLEPSYRYIANIIARNPNAKILVHCRAGISRSASVVIYYLMRSRGVSYRDALNYLQSKRPIVNPNPWYRQQLLDIERILKK
jgi:hypothetical protein